MRPVPTSRRGRRPIPPLAADTESPTDRDPSGSRDDDPTTEVVDYSDRELAGFRLGHEIGRGGMARVFIAHRQGLGGFVQTAALKVIRHHLARDPEFVERFLDEARIAGAITHPNVCRVLEVGESEGIYFLAMEHVLGESWASVLHAIEDDPRAQRLRPALTAYVLGKVCEGLHAAHEAVSSEGTPLGVVHRDVAPQNVLIGYDGSVRLLDFGVARAAERLHHTSDGELRGRYAYMSPEQVRGRAVDRRADIWSLGVMLHEAVTGARLFRRDTDSATLMSVVNDRIPILGPWIPAELREVAGQALERDPLLRQPTAREMGADLMRYAAGAPDPVDSAEVSELMQHMFAERLARKRGELSAAARAARTVVAARPPKAPEQTVPTRRAGRDAVALAAIAGLLAWGVELRARLASLAAHAFGWLGALWRGSAWRRRWSRAAPVLISLGSLALWVAAASLGAAAALPWAEASHAIDSPARAGVVTAPLPAAAVAAILTKAPPAPTPAMASTAAAAPAPKPRDDLKEPLPPRAGPLVLAKPVEVIVPEPIVSPKSPARRTRRRVVRRRRGTLMVATSGDLRDLFVGRRRLGDAPGRFRLRPGVYGLRLRFDGGAEVRREGVRVRSGQVTRVHIKAPQGDLSSNSKLPPDPDAPCAGPGCP